MKQVIEIEVAKAEISAFCDKKKRLPSKRSNLDPMVDSVAEAMSYGFVTIDGDVITQKLMEPVLNSNGGIALSQLVFNRPKEGDVRKEKDKLKMGANFSHELLCYTTVATGEPAVMINKLDSQDRDICDAISALFL